MDSVRVAFDSTGADEALDILLAASQRALRPAAQAGAEELYLEARVRCPVSAEDHVFYGRNSRKSGVKYRFAPGTLRNAIYQVFSKDNSSEFGAGYRRATYHVGWNHQEAPYGFMVEFGTSRAPAHPFLGPAYDARVRASLGAALAAYKEKMRGAGVR